MTFDANIQLGDLDGLRKPHFCAEIIFLDKNVSKAQAKRKVLGGVSITTNITSAALFSSVKILTKGRAQISDNHPNLSK